MARKLERIEIVRDPLRYLKRRENRWHYVRRVPAHFAHIDGRGVIQISLKTSSLDVAQLRRDALERADELYWQGLSLETPDTSAGVRYAAAKARAKALGFEYKAAVDIAESTIEDIVRRISVAGASVKEETAVLGAEAPPQLSVRQAMNLYLDEIAVGETKGMSPQQVENWRKVKLSAAERFCEVVSDKPLLGITRADALAYFKWWQSRVTGDADQKALSGNSANRSFGNMRKLFREYTRHLALEVKNPFDGLSFRDPKSLKKKVLPFEADYIRTKFLTGNALADLNREAKLIFLALIETGCRPSEICNLTADAIHLDAPIPYLSIVYREDRKIKTENSVRDIPLVGVSLEAMKLAPKGFPRYADKETNLSAVLMKHLRTNKLLPSDNHRVYSIRHAMEKRMLEAGLSDEFRRRIMGHDTKRPDYGDGGSMEWRRDQLLKIVLPFSSSVLN